MTMKRVNMYFEPSRADIDIRAKDYFDLKMGDVPVDFLGETIDEWDVQGRLVRIVLIPWDFDPDRLLDVARRHPEVFADLRFDVEGPGENLTFEAMILRAWEKLSAVPAIAPVLPRFPSLWKASFLSEPSASPRPNRIHNDKAQILCSLSSGKERIDPLNFYYETTGPLRASKIPPPSPDRT